MAAKAPEKKIPSTAVKTTRYDKTEVAIMV